MLTALVWLAGFAGARPRAAMLGVVVAGLVGVIAMQLARRAGITTWPVAVPVSVAAGISAAIAYQRLAAGRTFLTALSVAILVVPGMFLARPEIRRLIGWPAHQTKGAEATGSGTASSTTPVVMIIFDELPLLSLLDADRQIDPVLYPNFAALAHDGVWYRNATTVNDFTRWAVPSIVSGNYPRHTALPNAVDHPNTVFTLLARTHRLEVVEAVTRLCPETLCEDREAASLGARLAAIARDLRVVFLLSVLTDDLAAGLPDVTATWAGFDRSQDRAAPDGTEDVQRRWREGMGGLHVEPIRQFIDGIGADDPQPTFYFLHTLISHHPYYMLPGDRKNRTWVAIPGKVGGHWGSDQPWAVAQQYQRHLLQVGFVDGLVGRLVQRLKDIGLYDRALVVITADHGISFVPGAAERNVDGQNAAEIMRVPLIVKFPDGTGSRGGVSDANVETIDIVPTMADALHVGMDWQPDGVSVLDPSRPARQTKTVFSGATGSRRALGADAPDMRRPLARKLELFGDGAHNRQRAPRLAPLDDLIGRPLTALRVADGGGAVEVLNAWEYTNVDPAEPVVPFDVSGRFASPRPDTRLAVAVNGVVEAVTRTWEANPRGWLATPRFDVWRPGPNDLQVFVVESDASGALLRRAGVAQQRPPDLNLILEPAAREWGVRQWGFYPVETVAQGRQFRWTRDVAEISNAFTHRPPTAVLVEVMMVAGGRPKNLTIEANDCTLFEGEVEAGWSATLPLARCNVAAEGLTLRFTTAASRGDRDRRRLGVAVSRVTLQ